MIQDLYGKIFPFSFSLSHAYTLFCFGIAGVYEAVSGDFLDAHSLRLLNPYMVSVLHGVIDSWFRPVALCVNL